MRSLCLGMILILGLTLSVQALPVLELEPGSNQISVLVVNKRTSPLHSVDAAVKGDLPGWLKITSTVPVDVPARGEGELILSLEVGDVPAGTSAELPLVLKDRRGRSWEFKALVQVAPPGKYELLPNFPNPFNPTTTIRYALARKGPTHTELLIFDALGQKVRTLVNKPQSAGVYSVVWDGRDEAGLEVATGLYFYRIVSGDFVQSRKMLLLR